MHSVLVLKLPQATWRSPPSLVVKAKDKLVACGALRGQRSHRVLIIQGKALCFRQAWMPACSHLPAEPRGHAGTAGAASLEPKALPSSHLGMGD